METNNKRWEEEFDQEFGKYSYPVGQDDSDYGIDGARANELKAFIRKVETQTEERVRQEMKEGCRVCGKPTEQIFNIDCKETPVCADCEYRIVKQSVMDMYK